MEKRMSKFDSTGAMIEFADEPGGSTPRFAMHVNQSRPAFWRRVWFLISAVPRYLISGSVEVP